MDDSRYSSDGSGCSSSQCNLQEISSMPLLGLKLRINESVLNLVEARLQREAARNVGSEHHPMSEKLKASNFPITTISVGNWQRVSRHEGELTAKLYFAKRKLVWEFLDGQLKSKMEVSWTDITAIEAVMHPNQPGYLQIELGNPPLFFREITPQPRKHTNWQQATDFTDGQAPLYRRHFAMFPPGELDKHYGKLLQCDQHLLELSRRPFPSHQSPYFNTALPLQFNISGYHHPQMQPSVHPTLNPTITAAVTARNSGVGAAVWGNQINREAVYVDSSRQNQQHIFPRHQHRYEYDETAFPYIEIPQLNLQMNHNIPPNSYPTRYGLSDEMQNIGAAGEDVKRPLVNQIMVENAAGGDDAGWSLFDVYNQNGNDGNWLDSHIQGNAAADDSFLPPHIQIWRPQDSY